MIKRFLWVLFVLLAIAVGLYPAIYFLLEAEFGLLTTKPTELLSSLTWQLGFNGHIIFGGLGLLTGWSQFSKRLRSKRIVLHRNLGKAYIIAVIISGFCGIYIGFYATGGLIAELGFILLGITWLVSTVIAYLKIRRGDSRQHEYYMIFSYAACFAAVTLRLWFPLLTGLFGAFIPAYRLVAWLCWVPNIIVAYFIVRQKIRKESYGQIS